MNPGATIRPDASMTRAARTFALLPRKAIRSPRIPTSTACAGEPEPSRTDPFSIRTSNTCACNAAANSMVLRAINRTRRIRLPDTHIGKRRRPDFALDFIEDEFRNVFGGRIDGIEGLELVDKLMIQILAGRPQTLLQLDEIVQQSVFIQRGAFQAYLHTIVVPVHVF